MYAFNIFAIIKSVPLFFIRKRILTPHHKNFYRHKKKMQKENCDVRDMTREMDE